MNDAAATSSPAIRTLLLCDLVASTRLVERVGDAAAAELLARHDRIARDLLATFNGREIDKSDGFLLLFERPIEAVRFALAYHAKLRELGASLGAAHELPISTRVGIHLGEVVLRANSPADVARGAKPVEVEGLAKAVAARVMSLAGGGRTLLTRAAYDFARRAAVGLPDAAALRWAAHGHYRLAGVEDPVEVCEVAAPAGTGAGAEGGAGLVPPPDSEKVQRVADAAERSSVRAAPQAPPTQPPPGAAAAPASTPEPLVAVLAFDNLSADPDMQFFSDGVSEEIILRLSRGAQLKVMGRASSFQFRGERKAEAAQALGCTHVLDGSIRRAAARVRISAHLVEAASRTTAWSDRFDRGMEDIFAVQDEISENIAGALSRTFSSFAAQAVAPSVYDLYLRASPKSFAPDELRTYVGLLEVATQQAPHFAPAWGRLAFVRAFLRFYQPFAERAASAALVQREAARALEIDAQNLDAMTARLFAVTPFGRFGDFDAALVQLQQAPGTGEGRQYVGWCLRTMGRVRESLESAEREYRLNALDPMHANQVALARMAAGRVAEAVPVYEELVQRVPGMSFPVSSLLRAYAFQRDWAGVDRLLALAEQRQLREFQDGLPFIRAKRNPTPEVLADWRSGLEAHVAKTGCIDVSRLVYAAHLGLVDEAYQAVERARLGPNGSSDDLMGPDGYRTHLLFQAGMPELRNDARFVRLCARLGLVEFWLASGKWPDCADEVPYDFRAECAAARLVAKDDFGF